MTPTHRSTFSPIVKLSAGPQLSLNKTGKKLDVKMKSNVGLTESLPILFVYIGWAERYDGTEPIQGDFSYFRKKSAQISEAYAFYPDRDGLYRCGVGRGQILSNRLNVVFVARDNRSQRMKIVGIYLSAKIEMDGGWAVATCRHSILVPSYSRPELKHWPAGQGLRRWAWRGGKTSGKEYAQLRKAFAILQIKIKASRGATQQQRTASDIEYEGFEGEMKLRFVAHRSRENRLRLAKIREALDRNQGKLICEVPRCGFDFGRRYGELGAGYAHVHHLRPLRLASLKGTRVKQTDLVIVCANCHAMIHKGGDCRPLKNLIPR